MKTKNSIFRLFKIMSITILLAFSSCSDDIDDNPIQDTSLNGTWKLVKVRGTVAGINETFPEGEIIWKINTEEEKIQVTNNHAPQNPHEILQTGNYEYDIVENTVTDFCSHTIVIDGINYGCFSVQNGILVLSQVESDGYEITLKR